MDDILTKVDNFEPDESDFLEMEEYLRIAREEYLRDIRETHVAEEILYLECTI